MVLVVFLDAMSAVLCRIVVDRLRRISQVAKKEYNVADLYWETGKGWGLEPDLCTSLNMFESCSCAHNTHVYIYGGVYFVSVERN